MKNEQLNENEPLRETAVMQSVILPNELRIGNLVECFGTREVIAIKKHKIKVQHEKSEGHFIIEWVPITSLSLQPILLTEKTLLNFKEVVKSNVIYLSMTNLKSELHFEIFGDEVVTTLKGQFCELILDRIKYVHQLQNIWFSLTNRDLLLHNSSL